MSQTVHTLTLADVKAISDLDQRWFGKYGASEDQLARIAIDNPNSTIVLRIDGDLSGFASFEILQHKSPTDYIGDIQSSNKVLFIQQFTTTTNYSSKDMSMDIKLLKAVEDLAKENDCSEVWEALSVEHPYSSSKNPLHDAYGFYESQGYSYDHKLVIYWSPDPATKIPCYLFSMKLAYKQLS